MNGHLGIAYALDTDAPLDLTFQTLLSGEDSWLGKGMEAAEGETVIFWKYGNTPEGQWLGAATVEFSKKMIKPGNERPTVHFWTGPLRSLTREERRACRRMADKPCQGGAWIDA